MAGAVWHNFGRFMPLGTTRSAGKSHFAKMTELVKLDHPCLYGVLPINKARGERANPFHVSIGSFIPEDSEKKTQHIFYHAWQMYLETTDNSEVNAELLT